MDNKWFELGANEQPLDIIKETCGFAGIFKQIGVIGDSLASGEFESHDENGSIVYTDMYEYSWPAVLERITGTKYNNYSRGGMTAREYMQSWADANGFWQWNQAPLFPFQYRRSAQPSSGLPVQGKALRSQVQVLQQMKASLSLHLPCNQFYREV